MHINEVERILRESVSGQEKRYEIKRYCFTEKHTQLEDIRMEVYLPLDFSVNFSFENYKPGHFIKQNPIACWQDMISPNL